MLSPLDLQNQRVTSRKKRYDKIEVDDYVDLLLENYKEAFDAVQDLEKKIKTLSEGVQYYRSIESTMQKALVLAEKTSKETKDAAIMKAEAIEKDANTKASKIVAEAEQEYDRIKEKCVSLVQNFNQYKMQLKQVASAQLELVTSSSFDVYSPELDALQASRNSLPPVGEEQEIIVTQPDEGVDDTVEKDTTKAVQVDFSGSKPSAPSFEADVAAPSFGTDIPVSSFEADVAVPSFGTDVPASSFEADAPVSSLEKDAPVSSLEKDALVSSLEEDAPVPSLKADAPAPSLGVGASAADEGTGREYLDIGMDAGRGSETAATEEPILQDDIGAESTIPHHVPAISRNGIGLDELTESALDIPPSGTKAPDMDFLEPDDAPPGVKPVSLQRQSQFSNADVLSLDNRSARSGSVSLEDLMPDEKDSLDKTVVLPDLKGERANPAKNSREDMAILTADTIDLRDSIQQIQQDELEPSGQNTEIPKPKPIPTTATTPASAVKKPKEAVTVGVQDASVVTPVDAVRTVPTVAGRGGTRANEPEILEPDYAADDAKDMTTLDSLLQSINIGGGRLRDRRKKKKGLMAEEEEDPFEFLGSVDDF